MLSNSGHIQSLLNPPGNPKACILGRRGASSRAPRRGCEQATKHAGSWWPHWLEWIKARSGEMGSAPASSAATRIRRSAQRPADTSWRNRVQISLHDVGGQTLRVGVRPGRKAAPPLLLFNGIGASIELVEPFLDALDGPEVIVFDVPGVGGSPAPQPALSPLDAHAAERAAARSAGARPGGRARRLVGRRARAAICLPARQALPAARARGHIAGPSDGAWQADACC